MGQLFMPGDVIGYRKNGSPIRLIAGGSQPVGEVVPVVEEARFTAADIEKARQQEKDKLYGNIEKVSKQTETLSSQNATMLEELAALKQEREERVALEQKAREKAEAEVQKAQQAKMSAEELIAAKSQEWDAKVNEVNQSWEQRFEQIAQERAQERIMAEKEREFVKLSSYVQRRQVELDAEAAVHPSLMDLITGNTEAEIEQSIAILKAKTDDIVKDAVSAAQVARSQMPGVSTAGYGNSGPVDNGQKVYSNEELKGMNMQEWSDFRNKTGIGKGSGYGHGILG